MFCLEAFDLFQTLPYDSSANYTNLRTFTGGLVAAHENGILAFYKHVYPENGKRRWEFLRKWNCKSLTNYRVVSMTTYELNKDTEIYLAIATKNQSIIYLNFMKQIY